MKKSLLALAIAIGVTLAVGSLVTSVFVTPGYSEPKPIDSDR